MNMADVPVELIELEGLDSWAVYVRDDYIGTVAKIGRRWQAVNRNVRTQRTRDAAIVLLLTLPRVNLQVPSSVSHQP